MEQQTADVAPPDKEQPHRRTMTFLAVAGMVLVGLIYAVTVWDQAVSCPNELIGAWETSVNGYEDGLLVFTKTGVTFSTGTEHMDAQAIRRIEAIPEGPRTLYTVTYGDSQRDEQTLSFYYHASERTITFKNQSHLVWTRKSVES